MAKRDDKRRAPGARPGSAPARPPLVEPVAEPVVEPFASDDHEWETELDAWDRALPIAGTGDTTEPLVLEQNAFHETPITESDLEAELVGPPTGVVSGRFESELTPTSGSYAALVTEVHPSLNMAIPTGTFDDSASQSGSYAAIVADVPVSRVTTIFDLAPPEEPPVPYPSETLPEMGAALWEGEASVTLTIGQAIATTGPDVETWRELGQTVEDELAKADTPERRADLALAAARLAELLGDPSGARGYVERALANDRLMGVAAGGWTAAHRARLCLAERAGTVDDDAGATESLARLASLPHPDQPAYRALQTEWALVRAARGAADGAAAGLVAGLPEGMPRTLGEAELAWRDPAASAAILAQSGHARGDLLGAALLVIAAARNEVRRDFATAADQRAAAAALDPRRLFARAGLLRDVARQPVETALSLLRELLPLLTPSPLKVALALWAARLAARAGRPDDAWSLLADPASLGPVTAALVRERLTLRLTTGVPIVLEEGRELLGALLERFAHGPARVVAAGFACAWAADDEARAVALERIEDLRAAGLDVAAIAPAIEALANRTSEPELRRRALRLWRDSDPARWLPASYALAADDRARGGDSLAATVEAEVSARVPGAPLFLERAARAVREGRFADASASLEQGARAWAHSRLGGPLRELAAERLARVALEDACERLDALAADDADPAVRLTLGRALRALRDGPRWLRYVRGLAAEAGSPARVASLLLERHFWDDGAATEAGAAALDEAFGLVPLHPIALGLTLAGETTAASLAGRWVEAAQASAEPRLALEAASLLSAGGEPRRALELLLSRLPVESTGRAAADVAAAGPLADALHAGVRRLAWAEGDAAGRAALLQRIGLPDEPIPVWARVLDGSAGALASPPAGRPLSGQLEGPDAPVAPRGEAFDGPDASDRLAPLEEAARARRWPEVVDRLIDAAPSGATAAPDTLSLALDLEAAHPGPSPRAPGVLASIGVAVEGEGGQAPSPALGFHAFARAAQAEPAAARMLEAAAALATRLSDGRSAALFLLEAAHADPPSAERLLRAAVERDPASAPAASARRRLLVREGRLGEAAAASAAEAEALVDLPLRVAALVRAAALIQAEAQGAGSPGAEDRAAKLATAVVFLRRALALAPEDKEIFGRLRDVHEELGAHAALAELLLGRLAVTSNPFETTALHLARAELFAGPLGEPARARGELAAILTREPNHARALGRLADLEESEGNFAATAELLVQRSAGERSPERLRELFLRLGRIHVQQLPDTKRAIAAYARVLQLDAKNQEALDALSLLYIERGDTKNANAMTERLLGVEESAARRVVYHLRLGHLAERAGDQLAALEHFRRAVDEAPRDIRAIVELARYLEKVHDLASRRHMLDGAAGQLRGAVLARPASAADRDALATVQRLRGRAASADAAVELGVFLASSDETAQPGAASSSAAGRRLTALASQTLDDRLFPASVPPSVRHLFRVLAPVERSAYRPEPARWGAERAHRVGDGRAPRDVFDRVAADLGAGPYDLYVTPSRVPPPLVALPGKPAAIVVGAALLRGGPAAVRFVAGRTLRLTSSSLDIALAGGDADLATWLTGVIRQFVPTYQRADVTPDQAAAATARMGRQLPKKARPELLPFALESSGELDVAALAAGIREGADRVGLLASGSLAAALDVIFTAAGERPSADALRDFAEARALLEFALSDEHDDLVQLLGDAR